MDLPNSVVISEEGPREGFQIEPGPISTADKIALIDALSVCGLRKIQVASFVNPKHVPGWADADAVVAGFTPRKASNTPRCGSTKRDAARARIHGKLTLAGFISLNASEPFAIRNLNRDRAGQIEAMREYVRLHREAGVPIAKIIVMAAFGCNFAGDISPATSSRPLRIRALSRAKPAGYAGRYARRFHGLGHAEAGRGRHRRRSGSVRRFADRAASARHARAGHRLRL